MVTEICLKLFMYSVWLVLDKEKLGQSILWLLVDLWKRKNLMETSENLIEKI